MGNSKEVDSLDLALEEIKLAKAKLIRLRKMVKKIGKDESYCKEDVENGAKRVQALVIKTKQAFKKL